MLICVEGIDLTGKSALARRFGGEVLHAGAPKGHPIDEYEAPLFDYRPDTGRDVVLDRWHLGELIWPAYFGRASQLDVPTFLHIELFLRALGCVLVLAEARETAISERLAAAAIAGRHEDIKAEHAGALLLAFKQAFGASILLKKPYDFERDDAQAFVNAVTRRAQSLAYIHAQQWQLTEWIGFRFPNVLYVGERPNDSSVLGPPFLPTPSASGRHLMRALPPGKPAFVNAIGRDGEPTPLRAVWRGFGRPAVVALGNTAHHALNHASIEHGVARHPQWARRFKHHQLKEYASALRQAAEGSDTRRFF